MASEERHDGIQPDIVIIYKYDYLIFFEIKCELPQVPIDDSKLIEQLTKYFSSMNQIEVKNVFGVAIKFSFPTTKVSIGIEKLK
jgi:hypothetical protein